MVAIFHGASLLEGLLSATFWPQALTKSSPATSTLFLITILITYPDQKLLTPKIAYSISLGLYLIGGFALSNYFASPETLYRIPGFESFSWPTALYFMFMGALGQADYLNSNDSKVGLQQAIDLQYFKISYTELYRYYLISPVLGLLFISFFQLSPSLHFTGTILFLFTVLALLPIVTAQILRESLLYSLHREKASNQVLSKVNKRLNQKNQMLFAETEMRKQAAQITSHNLRGHAVAIRSVVEMLNTEALDEATEHRLRELLLKRVNENIETLDALGEFYNRINEKVDPTELCEWQAEIEKSFKRFEVIYGKADLEIENELPPVNYPYVYFKSMIYNIISNAFKYKSPKRRLVLKVRFLTEGNRLIYQFEDNGKGLALEQHGHNLFKFRKTFHGNRDAVGIGLFMTKAQMEKCGHQIEFHSKEDRGSILSLKFNPED